MNRSSAKVLSYLTGDENIDKVSLGDLQKLADESPYFPVTQFLVTKKLKAENSAAFISHAQKTVLYFANPYWFHYQLSEEADVVAQVESKPETGEIKHFAKTSEKEVVTTNEENHPVTTHFSNDELIAASDLAHETLQETAEPEVTAVSNDYKAETHREPITESQPEEEASAITRNTDETTEEFINQLNEEPKVSTVDLNNEFHNSLSAPAETEVVEIEEEMAGASHEIDNTTEKFLAEADPATRAEELNKTTSVDSDVPRNIESAPAAFDNTGNDDNEQNVIADEHDRMFENIKAMLDATSDEANADIDNAVIPIDPYYTIDYFASQGIKLEIDQNPQDQLGQHLKKFTQWLKHMKKLGPEDATEAIIKTETESDIQKIADSSNTVREVVTEAMASVLEKQGKKDKAIELYNKLSFLNPHKSPYFADKIKNLKGI